MKDIVNLLRSMRVKNIKVKSMEELRFTYINTTYVLIVKPNSIEIKLDVLTFSFDRNDDTLDLIRDFLNM